MLPVQEVLLQQIARAIDAYETARSQSAFGELSDLPERTQSELLTVMMATIERVAPSC